MSKKIVELFAGVGGFRIGLSKSLINNDFVWANQWEPSRKSQSAFDCYIKHFGDSENHVNEDINKIDKAEIPDHDLLVGGFPCQDYSVARTQGQGLKGKKGVLWWDIYDVIKEKQPNFILLENVDRLLRSPANQRGRDFGVMLSCLNTLNYSVEWRVLNAAEYGFSQRRRRVFVFAYKNNTKYSEDINNKSVEDIVHKDGFFQSKFPTIPTDNNNKDPLIVSLGTKDLEEISNSFNSTFYNSGIMINNSIYTAEVKPNPDNDTEYILLEDILEKDVDQKYYLGSDLSDWEYMKGSKKIERTHRNGHKYIFSEGAIPFPDPIDRAARTMLTSEASKNRSTHIVKDPQTNELRKLTPVECERLNGFPDNWTDTGMSERFRYFCMGNALVVDLVELMGEKLNEILDNENS